MTPRDIMLDVFRFRKNSVQPHNLYLEMITPSVRGRLDAYYGGASWIEKIDQYIYGNAWLNGPRTPYGDGLVRDAFGCTFKGTNVTHRVSSPLCMPTLRGYSWPEAEDLADWDDLAVRFRKNRHSFRLLGVPYGYLERSMFLRGFENLMIDTEEHPRFVHDLMASYHELRLEAYRLMAKRIEFDAVFGGGDDCDNRGPLMGIDRWRRFVKPLLKMEIAKVHELGKPYLFHGCGNIIPLLDDLLEIGIDALDPLQPEPMDVFALKKKVAGRLVLFGGMGTQSTLPFGTPREVAAVTRRLVREMGDGGGYVLQPSKPILDDVPTINAVTFIETALEATGHGNPAPGP